MLEFSKYVGVPYVDHGRGPDGWDCYGLYYYVSREHYGVEVPAYSTAYPTSDSQYRDAAVSAAIRAKAGAWQRVAEPVPGDGIVFNLAGQPLHCGIVIGDGIMLHCLRGRGTAIEEFRTASWVKRIEGYYRWK